MPIVTHEIRQGRHAELKCRVKIQSRYAESMQSQCRVNAELLMYYPSEREEDYTQVKGWRHIRRIVAESMQSRSRVDAEPLKMSIGKTRPSWIEYEQKLGWELKPNNQ